MIKNSQENLFKFMNKNKIVYAVLRGYDNQSKKLGKDLDILILKKDYEKFKNKFPKTDRDVDFYLDVEKHKGIIFIPKSALNRRIFNEKKGFFVLHEKDHKKMNFLRSFIKASLIFRKPIRKLINIFKLISRNIKMFGLRYILLDFPYQFFRFLYNKTSGKNLKKENKKDLIIKKVNDYEMIINKNGKGIHRDLFLKGTRESVSVDIVKELLKEGEIVLEAGANIGYYAILESIIIGKKGIVYAVEPIKENFELLKKNISHNNLKNVKAFNIGFSDKQGELKINVSSEGNLNSPREIGNILRIENVKCETLDRFFKNKKNPTFMRMDIEGYEDIVFNGGDKTLDNLNKIFVELHFPLIGKERMTNLLNKLKEKGFEIHKAVMEWERLEDEKTSLGRIVNYLYKKRSKPVVYTSKDLTIDKLIKSKEFIKGHLSLEVFFVKNKNGK
jgi:FkbM family methyltransferase